MRKAEEGGGNEIRCPEEITPRQGTANRTAATSCRPGADPRRNTSTGTRWQRDLRTITSLGFSPSQARSGLLHGNGTVTRAVEWILEHESSTGVEEAASRKIEIDEKKTVSEWHTGSRNGHLFSEGSHHRSKVSARDKQKERKEPKPRASLATRDCQTLEGKRPIRLTKDAAASGGGRGQREEVALPPTPPRPEAEVDPRSVARPVADADAARTKDPFREPPRREAEVRHRSVTPLVEGVDASRMEGKVRELPRPEAEVDPRRVARPVEDADVARMKDSFREPPRGEAKVHPQGVTRPVEDADASRRKRKVRGMPRPEAEVDPRSVARPIEDADAARMKQPDHDGKAKLEAKLSHGTSIESQRIFPNYVEPALESANESVLESVHEPPPVVGVGAAPPNSVVGAQWVGEIHSGSGPGASGDAALAFERSRFESQRTVRTNDGLVSAHLVDEGTEDEQEKVLAVAQEVSSGHVYIGRKRIKVYWIASCLLAIVIIATAVTLSVVLTKEAPADNAANECSPNALENIVATVGPISEDKICGGYYPNFAWETAPCLANVHPNYNVIFLFAARPTDALDGSISFSPPPSYDDARFLEEVQAERSGGHDRAFVLTVGGQNNGFRISDRNISRTFVDGFEAVYGQVGGLDGLDWGIFSDGHEPATDEMAWIGLELKRLHGPEFFVSAWVQPDNQDHLDFCNATIASGAVDYCSLEFFNRPGFTQQKIMNYIRDWSEVIGEEHIMAALAVHETADDYHPQRLEEAVEIYNEIKKLFPSIGGTNNWSIPIDDRQGHGFATQVCAV